MAFSKLYAIYFFFFFFFFNIEVGFSKKVVKSSRRVMDADKASPVTRAEWMFVVAQPHNQLRSH